jgi:hypothetical protein
LFLTTATSISRWAFDWTEIIADARSRLQFINESLRYEASRETSKAYLVEAHAKFIPVPEPAADEDTTPTDRAAEKPQNSDGNT